jgi:hypothetical protein
MHGKIGDHVISINVKKGTGYIAGHIYGMIDGEEIDKIDGGRKIAADIFNKYLVAANLQNDQVFGSRASSEIYNEDKENDPEYVNRKKKEFQEKERVRVEKEKIELEKKKLKD